MLASVSDIFGPVYNENHTSCFFMYKAVNLIKDGGEHLMPEFEAVNPMKAIPALLIDANLLTESVAIIEYLDETRPDPPLLPKTPLERAKVRRIVEIINADIQPLQNLRVTKRLPAEIKTDWLKHFIGHGFTAIEQLIKGTAGKYCFGDTVTIADCYLVPQLYSARRFEVDLTPFPTIVRVEAELSKLPAFEAAHANNQPDTPNPLPK